MTPSKAKYEMTTNQCSPKPIVDSEIAQVLDFFRDDLPDPTLQLFNQSYAVEVKFHLFKRLPVELRLNIWELGCTVPRTIHLFRRVEKLEKKIRWVTIMNEVRRHRRSSWIFKRYGCSTKNPGCLSTNHESRLVAMKYYHPLLRIDSSVIYFNPAIDTVSVTMNRQLEQLRYQPALYRQDFAKDLYPNASEICQRLELRCTTWNNPIFPCYGAPFNNPHKLKVNCISLSGRIISSRNIWEHFRNLRRITIIQPRVLHRGYQQPIAVEPFEGIAIRNRILGDFEELKRKYHDVLVPDILLDCKVFTIEHVGEREKNIADTVITA